ncbi:MAG: 2-phosphosulfolactate phosphatase [Proteobacteria bacterium]|nr:2-phosphosulfolactate phosphatase [Pseudomonadota bacterium]
MPRIYLVTSWQEVYPERLKGATAVVIDVLAATTNIITGLAHGVERFILARDREETEALAQKLPPESRLRAGEIGSSFIREFELSPLSSNFRSPRVRGQTIVLNTTNGTRAAYACRPAARVILAAVVNARAVVDFLVREQTEKITIVCSGNLGKIAYEDFFCGGLLVEKLLASREYRTNDAALAARDVYRQGRERTFPAFLDTLSSRAILTYGTEDEIRFAAQEDLYSLVPGMSPHSPLGLEIRA